MLDTLEGISFFAKDLNFRLIFANPHFYRRLGLKSQKELLGKNDFELFPEPLAKKFRKDDEWIIEKSKPMTGLIELFLNLQGIPAWYLTNKFPIMNKKGKPIGVMAVQDMTKTASTDWTEKWSPLSINCVRKKSMYQASTVWPKRTECLTGNSTVGSRRQRA